MKKMWLFLTIFVCGLSINHALQAHVIVFGPTVQISQQQPVQAIIVDCDGNKTTQTFYYDPSLGGINVDSVAASPCTSIYFPNYNTKYLWYNGYWVDEEGHYWDNGHYAYINHPHWHDHWHSYWGTHWHDGGWHDRWHSFHDNHFHHDGHGFHGRGFDFHRHGDHHDDHHHHH